MYVADKLWGVVEDVPLVVQDLLLSPAMQRLKGIDQSGIPERYHPKHRYSRYGHSVGVYVLFHRLGAPLPEQIAGLLHDVSHTACSHLIDWVQGNHQTEHFQDARHASFITEGSIGGVLRQHQYDPDAIVQYHHYPLLEQPAPIVCADRLDYGMREIAGWVAPGLERALIPTIETHEGKIIFSTGQAAHQFAHNFAFLQRVYWGGPEYMVRYRLLAEALGEGMTQNIISLHDFEGTDEALLGTLEQKGSGFPAIQARLDLLRKRRIWDYALHQEEGSRHLTVKFRSVDPLHRTPEGTIVPLSTREPTYGALLRHEAERTQKGTWIKFLAELPKLHKP
jgi:hypothetical protein